MENQIEKLIKRVRGNGFVIGILAMGVVVTGIVTFVIQAIVYVTVRPWSLRVYRKMSYYFSAVMYWHQLLLVQWWSNTEVEILVERPTDLEHMGKEHSILILNHKYEIDILIITVLCNYFGMEGNLRGFAKKSLQYLPIFGWLWKLQEHIFLERNFEKDKKILGENLRSLLGNGEDPVTLVLFPEGTRFTEDKHRISMEVARGKGLKELKYHLLPRTRGFETCVETLRGDGFKGSLPVAIYDGLIVMEMGTSGEKGNYSFTELTKGRGPKVKIFLRRWPVEGIGKEEAGQWLHKRYQEKDGFMESYNKSGRFGEGEEFGEDRFVKIPKRLGVVGLMGVLNLGICAVAMWWVGGIIMGGNVVVIGLLGVGMVGAGKVFKGLGDITKIKKGSTYGHGKGE